MLGVAATARRRSADVGPGLAIAAVALGLSWTLSTLHVGLSIAAVAVAFGIIIANTAGTGGRIGPGLRFAGHRVLRIGIVLLGFRLSLTDVGNAGLPMLAVVTVTVAITFLGTQFLGRALGVGSDASLLTATGYSICGASAIAAMNGTVQADEEDAAVGIALVTLFGTVAVFALPIVGPALGFEGTSYGAWVGASTHDVAQVVAAASAGGTAAASTAIVIKLTRVVLLAPLVAGVSLARRSGTSDAAQRPPLLPGFVIAFLAAVIVRSSGLLSGTAVDVLELAGTVCLGLAMVGLGAGVSVAKLRHVGPRPLLLGGIAWVLVAGVSAIGVWLVSS